MRDPPPIGGFCAQELLLRLLGCLHNFWSGKPNFVCFWAPNPVYFWESLRQTTLVPLCTTACKYPRILVPSCVRQNCNVKRSCAQIFPPGSILSGGCKIVYHPPQMFPVGFLVLSLKRGGLSPRVCIHVAYYLFNVPGCRFNVLSQQICFVVPLRVFNGIMRPCDI